MGEHTPPRENILLRDDGHVFSQRMQQQFACIRAGYFVEENRIAFFPKILAAQTRTRMGQLYLCVWDGPRIAH